MNSIPFSEKDLLRFWKKVEKGNENECWNWKASLHRKGYGNIKINNILLAHRISWAIHFGEIPFGMFVCHKCDNPKCVNPNHLFLGTNQDNMNDKMEKGRYKKGHVFRGSEHTNAKLSESEVLEIRRMYDTKLYSTRQIAKKFNVNSKTVWFIGKRIAWPHLK